MTTVLLFQKNNSDVFLISNICIYIYNIYIYIYIYIMIKKTLIANNESRRKVYFDMEYNSIVIIVI